MQAEGRFDLSFQNRSGFYDSKITSNMLNFSARRDTSRGHPHSVATLERRLDKLLNNFNLKFDPGAGSFLLLNFRWFVELSLLFFIVMRI